ncbi:MAG TPA: magnesium transporter CorA family protein [Candidatus Angelobacter sp.]|nr:magnesium transporter CorA family protein [Candidatus Angelobacter sp.]
MIQAYALRNGKIERTEIDKAAPLADDAVWLDIVQPTPEERSKVEAVHRLTLPTPEEVREIEPSDRLYSEGLARFMTATILVHADAPLPQRASITFILTGRALITLRYVEPRPVAIYAQKLLRGQEGCTSGEEALVGLLESFIDRIADILEKVNQDLDVVSQTIFAEGPATLGPHRGRRDLRAVIRTLGRNDDLVSTIRESLLSMTRVISYLTATLNATGDKTLKDVKTRLKSTRNDIVSLNEHAAFESHTINFQLDATLGMINIEQNGIIKIFSVAAVVFLPPTLVASVYGMNFDDMPELHWLAGYPWALGLMVVSALVPLIYFKRKGWL